LISLFLFYFQTAPESGVYQISVNAADNNVWFWLGSNSTFNCCTQGSITRSENDILSGVRSIGSYSSYVYLDKNIMYPMKVEYINYALGDSLGFSIVTPSGEIITDFSNTIVNFDTEDITNCDETRASDNLYSASTVAYIPATSSTSNAISATSNVYAYIPSTLTSRFVHFPNIQARDLLTPSRSYAYTGTTIITSTLIYETSIAGDTYTITDVAVLFPETTRTTISGYPPGTIHITTSAINEAGRPVLTTYDLVIVAPELAPSTTYPYTGTETITSSLIYLTDDPFGGPGLYTTDVAVLTPEITLTTWTGTFTSTALVTTIAVNDLGVPQLTTYTMLQVPSATIPTAASNTYAYTGTVTITSTIV
jgi:hypothetical protein